MSAEPVDSFIGKGCIHGGVATVEDLLAGKGLHLLADGLKSAMSDPVIRQQLESHGLQTAYLGPTALASHITQQYGRYAHLIDDAKITVQ